MELLSQKNIGNTLIYNHLIDSGKPDDFVSKVAWTVKETQELVEAGNDYDCDVDGYKVRYQPTTLSPPENSETTSF